MRCGLHTVTAMKFCPTIRTLALLFAVAPLSACDPSSILPKTADEAGMSSARVAVAMGVDGIAGLPAELAELELEVVDVLLHRESDDAWVLLANESTTLGLLDGPGAVQLTGIPIGTGVYDEVAVVFGDVRARDGLGWHDVEIKKDEYRLKFRNQIEVDARVDLTLEVGSAVKGGAGAWKMTPGISIEISDM